ncbi:hypothetical protein M409DRAFT_25223 [Zasmidium cellare ATCC 36951]|uniref:Acetyl-CoA synthetase-like protein n=1 Tax=Zasmidium cellare ATCC 36951 TaxID=1080233 RepID=A0A6A6CAZ1_ZASCE|nr:uncharacterized protein M409DRAFT_25223 [Zasmidium cellare ATCC 36951]KAF2164344.1 hypothetical protein M409DRAFT_25223 [Zasmidium cellare ATCC 36951]
MALWKSEHPDLDIPTNVTTWQWAFESREHSPVIYAPKDHGHYENAVSKERLSYAEVKEKATSIGTALVREHGFEVGDTVSLFASNTIWYPLALWATVRVGGRINGASPAYNTNEMSYALKVAKTKFLFTLPGSLDVATAAAQNVGIPKSNIFLLEGHAPGLLTIHDLIALGTQHPPVPSYTIPPNTTNKQICGYLNFSSGTTGLPKAVMLSHHNIIAQCHQLRQIQLLEPGEPYSILAVTPLFHITGLVRYIHYPIFMNGSSILLPSFTMPSMLDAILTYKIRELILVPPILIRIVRDPIVDTYLPALRRVVKRWSSGSAPTSPEIIHLLHAKFPDTGFRQGYGATESTACISAHPPDCYDYRHAHTAGKLVANTEGKVVDLEGTGRVLGVGETGEILARGPQIAMGYLGNEGATRETFDEDGFFHTGDVGHFDSQGLIHISDRIKEMIKVRGQQVAPAELEDVLLSHPLVEDCAVLGIPDDYSGEVPKGFVVLKEGVKPSRPVGLELLGFVEGRKVRYKRVREVEFVGSVPKSPTGKLLRRVLKERERDAGRVRGVVVREEGGTVRSKL